MANLSFLPMAILTDSYKAGHFEQYPACQKMVAYGEFRTAFQNDATDQRFVFWGIRYFVEQYLCRRWTRDEVEKADKFYKTHNAGFTQFPYPRDLFLKFVDENDGYFPVKFEALPEGTCAHVHVPVFQMTMEDGYSRLGTFLETLVTHCWYPCTVATMSRRARDTIQAAFDKSVDESQHFLIESRLHDFGFRGCTSVEQSVIGGTAHLLNFTGSDTMSACYYAQFELNNGKPVGSSIPATEHSVMTSWPSEEEAIRNMIRHYGDSVFACVLDSYNYQHCLNAVIPRVAEEKKAKSGFMVFRPDSGDPIETVLQGLAAGEATFGATVNGKGYKVLNGVGVIQGDGINSAMLVKIIDAVLAAGYSAQSVAFGMGGGLLQKVNRDTMSFATKLSHIVYESGKYRDVMKKPSTDTGKTSLPGILEVKRVYGIPTIFPAGEGPQDRPNLLKVVFDKRPVANAFPEDFDTLRARVKSEWEALPRVHDPLSTPMHDKITRWVAEHYKTLSSQ